MIFPSRQPVIEPCHFHLYLSSLGAMGSDSASVDFESFFQKSHKFDKHIPDLGVINCKTLLTYDWYQSDMSLRALEYLSNSNNYLYILAVQTSGKSHPSGYLFLWKAQG